MGSCSSKSNTEYMNTDCALYMRRNHCCFDDCFSKIENVKQLNNICNILWCFTDKHEKELREYLTQYKLDDVTQIIISYLNKLESTEYVYNDGRNNYNMFIHTAVSVLNGDNSHKNKVCPIWLGEFTNIKCVLLGAVGVGKSTLTMKFLTDKCSPKIDPTIEDSYIKQFALNIDREDIDKYIDDPLHILGKKISLQYKDRQYVTLDILDTAGITSDGQIVIIRDIWFRHQKIFFLVFNVMEQQTFDEIQNIWRKINWHKKPIWDKQHNKTNLCIIAVGNKCDLREDGNYERERGQSVVDMKKANEWFKEKQIPYIETSAKNGRNVNFLFRHCVYEYWIQSHTGCVSYE